MKVVLLLISLILVSCAFANDTSGMIIPSKTKIVPFNQTFYTGINDIKPELVIDEVEISELGPLPYIPDPYYPTKPESKPLLIVNDLIALGEKIYKIIEKGRPVVHVNLKPYSVLPKTVLTKNLLHDMFGWSAPVTYIYTIKYKNLYKAEVVKIKFGLTFQYNGQDDNGGKYLTGIRILPLSVKTLWGYRTEALSELIAISNLGTKEKIIGSATLAFKIKIHNVISAIETENMFHIRGNTKEILQI